MINGYTESEICTLYRSAKNKKLQINILTELTGLRTFEVEKILEEGGYLNQMTDLVKDRILELYKQELSDTAIAKELSLAQSQVSTFLRKQELPPNGKKSLKKIKEEEKKMEKPASYDVIEKLKKETQKNVEELKEILPKSIPAPEDLPIEYDIVEELTPQQYYELAKLTLELLKTIWG